MYIYIISSIPHGLKYVSVQFNFLSTSEVDMILTCCTNFILYKDCSTSLRVRNPSQTPIFPYLPIKPPIVVNSHGTSPSPLPSLTRHLKELFVGNQALDISLETYLAMDLDLFVDTDSLEQSKLPPGLKALIAISHPTNEWFNVV